MGKKEGPYMETNILRTHFDYLIQCTENLHLDRPLYNRYKARYEEIYLYCLEKQAAVFTYQDAAHYCSVKCPYRKKYAAKETAKAAYTVARYFEDGDFSWKYVTFPRLPICKDYAELIEKFRQELSKQLSPDTVRTAIIIIRQFLHFLQQSGKEDAGSITTDDVLDFVRREAPNHKGSMAKLLRTMKKFVCFLRSEDIVDLDADRFLGKAGRCRRKALPCFTDDELRSIFAQIDRTTDKGRRDYAIFLLAVRTGMRASDIAGLKLTDISWAERVIRIVQKKTKVSLQLPLPTDAGNAIADYILHSRPGMDNPYVFLRTLPPFSDIPVSPSLFNAALRGYMEAAGIAHTGWDGRSFHALRRTAGTKMVASGVPVSTVAQILGHRDMESSKRYISLDTGNMRECCLDIGSMRTRKEGLA